MTFWRRMFFHCPNLSEDSGVVEKVPRPFNAAPADKANLIGSLMPDGRHAPTLDVDLPCRVLPSTTPGHHHLFIDKALSWEQYRILLAVLAEVGIIQDGYYRASLSQGQSMVRKPGVRKEKAA